MKNKGKIQRQKKRTPTKLILATLLVLLIAVCLFSQSRQSTRAGELDKLDRLEPSLAWVDRYSTLPAGETVPVIVQFAQDESAGEASPAGRQSLTNEETIMRGRARVLYEAGAEPLRSCVYLPMHSARVTRQALDRLARDPRVAHISLDYPIQGSLYTTTIAAGADQIWNGAAAAAKYTGNGITVAIIDSGNAGYTDVGGRVVASVDYTQSGSYDDYGHGTHVAHKH